MEEINIDEFINEASKWLKEKASKFGYADCEDAWEATYHYNSTALVNAFKKNMTELKNNK